LQKLVEKAMENLRYMEGAPSVVVNTKGITEEQIMKVREQIDQELAEEEDDRIHSLVAEKTRRTRERNVGGRNERR
jgi:histone deacetylase HOS2